MDAFYALGPFGFRGPAAAHVPDQLTQSANRSHHLTGDPDAPAHWRAAGLRDEAAARAAFPQHLPVSTSILGFHVLAGPAHGSGDRPYLTLERHGSMHVDDVRAVLAAQGFGLTLGPKALKRLPLREYPD